MRKYGPASDPGCVRCVSCAQPRDRDGQRCRACQRQRDLKATLALLLWTECFVGGYFAMQPQPQAATTHHFAMPAEFAFHPSKASSGWVYTANSGHPGADGTRFAALVSNVLTGVNGEPAQAGATTGSLQITTSQTAGSSVFVSFAKRLARCAARTCSVRASFDQTDPEQFPAQDVSTKHASRLQLGDANRFAQRLSVAHELTLYASLGRQRQVILNFSVDGFQLALRSVRVLYAALPTFRA
jgi:hypothetical protein